MAWHAAARLHAAIRLAETLFRVTVPGPLKLARPRAPAQALGPSAGGGGEVTGIILMVISTSSSVEGRASEAQGVPA